MEVKLTLKLSKSVIEKAKQYAKKRKRSLSKLVEDYFTILSSKDPAENAKISPIVRELAGKNFGKGRRKLEERVHSVFEEEI